MDDDVILETDRAGIGGFFPITDKFAVMLTAHPSRLIVGIEFMTMGPNTKAFVVSLALFQIGFIFRKKGA